MKQVTKAFDDRQLERRRGDFVDLISLEVSNFRRFEGTATLKTQGKLVAIIGANETGKSSLLEALSSLNNDNPLPRRATTWGKDITKTFVRATFRLNASESDEMSKASRFTITKRASGERSFHFEPEIKRDWSLRDKVAVELRTALKRSTFQALIEQYSGPDFDLAEESEQLALALEQDLEDLPDQTISAISVYLSRVRKLIHDRPRYYEAVLSRLKRLHELEETPNPKVSAEEKIKRIIPTFAFFNERMRILDDSYSVSEIATEMPPSLANLLALAGVSIGELKQTIESGNVAEIRTLEDRANKSLKEGISNAWSQSDLTVRLACDAGALRILVQDTSETYSDLSERSDGLRQFVALRAFLARTHIRNPILLIDELEQRLHYDAQADLVQVLQKQELAPKIIYTTHSAGSLPEDLGVGVHAVAKRVDAPHYSNIINRFWEKEEPGFRPLLVGLGASTLAFFPTRRALIAEGPSEMLLVPHLLREALGLKHLDFQVVPGLSSVSRTQLPALNANGAHVCYLVDGDSGGADIVDLLSKAGVEEKFIIKLMVDRKIEHSIEDFINPTVLLRAANNLGGTYTKDWPPISRHEIAASGRAKALKNAFETRGQARFSKVDLAYAILDLAESTGAKIGDPRRSNVLREIGNNVRSRLSENKVSE